MRARQPSRPQLGWRLETSVPDLSESPEFCNAGATVYQAVVKVALSRRSPSDGTRVREESRSYIRDAVAFFALLDSSLHARELSKSNEVALSDNIREILQQEQEHMIDLATALGIEVPDVEATVKR